MTTDKPRRLGRGLEALLGSSLPSTTTTREAQARGDLHRLRLAEIRPNPFQPRRHFSETDLADLAASLRANGLLQPITVRPIAGNGYELIAGERRLRAAMQLGWEDIPALVRELDDRALLTLALVENLQRTDLDPLEEADGYQRLIDEFHLTQQQIAEAVGKDRSTVANMLRLLSLPPTIRRMVQEAQISLGHARALLSIGDEGRMTDLAKRVAQEGLTVREIERKARELTRPEGSPRRRAAGNTAASLAARRIEDDLRRYLQTDVRISVGDNDRGQIAITFYSADDLERVLDLVLGQTRERP